MIETAIEVTEGRADARVIAEILSAGRDMLAHPVDLMPYAFDTLATLAQTHQVIILTKGDLLDQERKVAQSGLGDLVHGVDIVSDKTSAVYSAVFSKYGHRAEACMMVGNSMKSDVLPALAAGAHGVHIPHALTWELERADPPETPPVITSCLICPSFARWWTGFDPTTCRVPRRVICYICPWPPMCGRLAAPRKPLKQRGFPKS
jgi:putative hydrolase of the HAD superfamily